MNSIVSRERIRTLFKLRRKVPRSSVSVNDRKITLHLMLSWYNIFDCQNLLALCIPAALDTFPSDANNARQLKAY